jgi:hypothetical protein
MFFGLAIQPLHWTLASCARNSALGSLMRNTTVRSSGVSTASTFSPWLPSKKALQNQSLPFETRQSQIVLTSAEVTGAPSWKVAPSRSVKE